MYHPVDVHAGARLRARRVLLGLSQTDLAFKVGVTFQQIQKYETGANRITAVNLYALTQILQVSADYFFQEISSSDRSVPVPKRGAVHFDPRPNYTLWNDKETITLVRVFLRIRNARARKLVLLLVQAFGASPEPRPEAATISPLEQGPAHPPRRPRFAPPLVR